MSAIPTHWEACLIQFVSDLRHIGGFLHVLRYRLRGRVWFYPYTSHSVKPLDELLGGERFYPTDAILCPVLYTLVVCYLVLKLSLNYLIASCFHKSFIMVPGKYTMKFIKMETLGTIFLSSEYTDVRDYKCYSCMIPDIMTIFDVRCKQESDVYMLQFIYVAMYNYETIIYGYLNR